MSFKGGSASSEIIEESLSAMHPSKVFFAEVVGCSPGLRNSSCPGDSYECEAGVENGICGTGDGSAHSNIGHCQIFGPSRAARRNRKASVIA